MRGADGGPWKIICALSALWVGLLYDSQSQEAALDLIKGWTRQDHDYLRAEVMLCLITCCYAVEHHLSIKSCLLSPLVDAAHTAIVAHSSSGDISDPAPTSLSATARVNGAQCAGGL